MTRLLLPDLIFEFRGHGIRDLKRGQEFRHRWTGQANAEPFLNCPTHFTTPLYQERFRETDAILHVVRCFADDNVVHVEGSVDPARDNDIIETELLLADLDTLTKRIDRVSREAKAGKKEDKAELEALQRALAAVEAGTQLRAAGLSGSDREALRPVNLLTIKPVLYVANMAEGDIGHESPWVQAVKRIAAERGGEVVALAGEIEAQIVELPEEDRAAFLAEEGLEEPGLAVLVRAAYRLLKSLETYFTAGPKEARAWTIPVGATFIYIRIVEIDILCIFSYQYSYVTIRICFFNFAWNWCGKNYITDAVNSGDKYSELPVIFQCMFTLKLIEECHSEFVSESDTLIPSSG